MSNMSHVLHGPKVQLTPAKAAADTAGVSLADRSDSKRCRAACTERAGKRLLGETLKPHPPKLHKQPPLYHINIPLLTCLIRQFLTRISSRHGAFMFQEPRRAFMSF